MKARTVSWINKHKNTWRVAILVLLVVAITGPWRLDSILMNPESSCSAPNIRLDNDYCGMPLPGMYFVRVMFYGLVYSSWELVTGRLGFVRWTPRFLPGLLLFPLVLPFFSTLLLILRGDRWRRQVFSVAVWGLAAGIGLWIGLWMGLSRYPKLFWVFWGIWLYIGLAASALILEVLTLAAGRRPSQG